jgi:hypothetical protein
MLKCEMFLVQCWNLKKKERKRNNKELENFNNFGSAFKCLWWKWSAEYIHEWKQKI